MRLRRKKQQDAPGEAAEPKAPGRIAQIKQTYAITRKQDPRSPGFCSRASLSRSWCSSASGSRSDSPSLLGALGFMTGFTLADVDLRTPRRARCVRADRGSTGRGRRGAQHAAPRVDGDSGGRRSASSKISCIA